jgi:lysozyme
MTVLLIDISNNNAVTPTAFPLLKAARIEGAWLKSSEGHTFDDRFFAQREQIAERAGLRVGAYHFANPGTNTPAEEAQHFLAVYRGHDDRRALKVVLDMERPGDRGRWLIDWARRWNHVVHDALGHWPLFYSSSDYITSHMGMTRADRPIGGGLWLAAYGRDDGVEHPFTVPAPWQRAVAHQFSSKGRVPGVVGNCDVTAAPRLRPLLAHPVIGTL